TRRARSTNRGEACPRQRGRAPRARLVLVQRGQLRFVATLPRASSTGRYRRPDGDGLSRLCDDTARPADGGAGLVEPRRARGLEPLRNGGRAGAGQAVRPGVAMAVPAT